MSKEGLPEISVNSKGRKVAVIAAQWYGKVTDALTERASQTLEEAGAEVTVVRVPGTFELPVACARLADKFDAMIALGVVDNLGKGAAGQAVQNANLMCGLPETAGLEGVPVWP